DGFSEFYDSTDAVNDAKEAAIDAALNNSPDAQEKLDRYQRRFSDSLKKGQKAAINAFENAQPPLVQYGQRRLGLTPDGTQLLNTFDEAQKYYGYGQKANKARKFLRAPEEQAQAPAPAPQGAAAPHRPYFWKNVP